MDRRGFLLISLAAVLDVPVVVVFGADAYVHVQGEVCRPGAVKHTSGMTLRQAIAQAGGLTSTASPRNTYLTRGGQTWKFNVTDILVYPVVDPEVQPGDIIQVSARLL